MEQYDMTNSVNKIRTVAFNSKEARLLDNKTTEQEQI
jgi:hypothetical protein